MLLMKWILGLGKLGYPVTKTQLLESVIKLIKHFGPKNLFKDDHPEKRGYNGFLARHFDISKRIPQSLTTCRALVSEEYIRSWFSKIRRYFVENHLMDVFTMPNAS
ncbi:hypothetical protein WA026_019324 [Henosepilachna vigintioctopunctata]|uniref:LAGLIDADG homing endonuclease n=1 Tax=Henosepilachna vigintioctopunctata TaxID=420089 RepID=A0AAW1U3Z9_9CUCU